MASLRQMERDQDWRVVRITEVNTATGHIEARDQYDTPIMIDLTNKPTLLVMPQIGEIWVVRRRGSDWLLEARYERVDVQVPVSSLKPGDARLEAPGTIYIVGNRIVLQETTITVSASVTMRFETRLLGNVTASVTMPFETTYVDPNLTPVGGMIDYAGASDPVNTNWLLCDGRAISRSTFPVLFNALGTTYGVGNGSTTFNIPDYRGRTSVGPDNMGTAQGAASRLTTNNARGNSSGTATVTLTALESGLRDHAHGITDGTHYHGPQSASYFAVSSALFGTTPGSGLGSVEAYDTTTTASGANITINNSGAFAATNAHNNMQPYQVSNKIIRVA